MCGNDEVLREVLLFGGEVYIADSTASVITRGSVRLRGALGFLRCDIVELDDSLLTSVNDAIGDYPELVVPRLTFTTFFFCRCRLSYRISGS